MTVTLTEKAEFACGRFCGILLPKPIRQLKVSASLSKMVVAVAMSMQWKSQARRNQMI
jgi:hypothetical protein